MLLRLPHTLGNWSQHLDTCDLLLLNHVQLPFGLSHEVLYKLVILSIDLPIPAEQLPEVKSRVTQRSADHSSDLSNSALANVIIGSVSAPFVRAVRITVL